jgi:preprotein translocase subunit SecF
MEAKQETRSEQIDKVKKFSGWYDKNYKTLLVIPVVFLVLCIGYLGYFYSINHDFVLKDTSLSGGTTITLQGDIDLNSLKSALSSDFQDVSIRKLTDITTGKANSVIIETSATPEQIKPALEKFLGYSLNDKNSTIEFTGPSLSQSFYKQLLIALLISFILMSITIFVIFRTFTPSIAVIFAAFADIVMPLAIINFFGMRVSAAGIAAFLMLIGYSVDTDVLLTTRALKTKGGTLNQRIYRAFKTGTFITLTALAAVLPAFLFMSGLPDSFRQIFIILSIGLVADIFNTWLTNASIIKWYCVKRRIE